MTAPGSAKPDARSVARRFLTLPFHRQLSVIHALTPPGDACVDISDDDALLGFFRQMSGASRLDELWGEIERHHASIGTADTKPAPRPSACRQCGGSRRIRVPVSRGASVVVVCGECAG